ncbi:MAG: hypothetical protein ACR2RA_17090, partial [Geminicoccaceae bacterium]
MTDDVQNDPIFHRHGIYGMEFPIPLEISFKENSSGASFLVNGYLLPTEEADLREGQPAEPERAATGMPWLGRLSLLTKRSPGSGPASSRTITAKTSLAIDVLARILRAAAESKSDERASFNAAEILAHAL